MKKSALIAAIGLSAAITASAAKPNIIYILADDMGPGDVMAYNKDCKFPTPHLDRMAAEGMKFMDAHSNSSVCTPTRYGILTGRYAWRTFLKTGVEHGHDMHMIHPDRETVASFLKKQGYNTACVGKWHLGMDWTSTDGKEIAQTMPRNVDFSAPMKNCPLDVGFDYFFGIAASLNMDPHAYIDGRLAQGTLEFLEDKEAVKARGFIGAKPGWAAKEFVQSQVLPDFTRKTCDWIRKNADQPFFVYMPLNSPHSPIVPSSAFEGKSGITPHGDFCMETDWAVGEVLNTLDELGVADNTIVIFTADNGTSPGSKFEHAQAKGHYSSWMYRGLKGTTWEGGHRVPFLVRWPEGVKSGAVSDQLICTTDLIATVAELASVELPENVGEDSVSFLPALKGKAIPNIGSRGVVHHSDSGQFSIRRGKWKLLFDNHGGSRRKNPKDKPVINSADLLLFDMQNDVEETTNVAAEHPEVVDGLKRLLAEYVNNGRSTPGVPQTNDPVRGNKKWTQIEVVKEYLN
ncbi:Arylsulfatase [Pontiella desulfatans]|uniref:Arylsulfatase n=1 Tax=Pontiella desulfatans TaxID=2750659 RepID=A0A6C2U851_PONDE|nr:arylsulfatase [Pontiella desulfatans]SPS74016.1 sulfatase S1_15 [Kiritimatiellales bacterium]VGO16278.1 Arylsulfatase [Pontiella desulfatans]